MSQDMAPRSFSVHQTNASSRAAGSPTVTTPTHNFTATKATPQRGREAGKRSSCRKNRPIHLMRFPSVLGGESLLVDVAWVSRRVQDQAAMNPDMSGLKSTTRLKSFLATKNTRRVNLML